MFWPFTHFFSKLALGKKFYKNECKISGKVGFWPILVPHNENATNHVDISQILIRKKNRVYYGEKRECVPFETCSFFFLLRRIDILRENDFQAKLIKEIRKTFPGCIVLKNDPNYKQGVPDLSIFFGKKWATLECKKSANEPTQPNQPYYVAKMNRMSFSRFIFPENKEEVLNDLRNFFERQQSCRSKSKPKQLA